MLSSILIELQLDMFIVSLFTIRHTQRSRWQQTTFHRLEMFAKPLGDPAWSTCLRNTAASIPATPNLTCLPYPCCALYMHK